MDIQNDIYREELMDIYKNPANRGHIPDPTVEVKEVNPMCGDELLLQLNISDNKITDAKFDGMACAISVVSASILTEELKGKTLKEAEKIDKQKLLDLIGITLTTSRVKCATLSLDALRNAIKKYETDKKTKD